MEADADLSGANSHTARRRFLKDAALGGAGGLEFPAVTVAGERLWI